jgi:eukaryotic-like serine/threonine-protein kinase
MALPPDDGAAGHDADPQFTGRTIAGRYRLGPRRGTGLDAAIFEAFDQQLRRLVTLKVVHPDLVERSGFEVRFEAEMEAAAGARHPNLAAIFDWGRDRWNEREVLFVVVEHLAGGSLREMIDRGRRLSPSQALIMALDICKGLDVLHRRGQVHGDIRPSTLVFDTTGTVRVIDVGLGMVLAEQMWEDRSQITNERASYVSPEQASERVIGSKGDIYSLCLTILEATGGSLPFVGESAAATLGNRVGRLMPVNADLGPLASVLERAGRPDPEQRFTAAEFGRALVQAAEKMARPEPIRPVVGGLFDRPTAVVPVTASRPTAGRDGVGLRLVEDQPLTASASGEQPTDTTSSDVEGALGEARAGGSNRPVVPAAEGTTPTDPTDPTFPARRPSLTLARADGDAAAPVVVPAAESAAIAVRGSTSAGQLPPGSASVTPSGTSNTAIGDPKPVDDAESAPRRGWTPMKFAAVAALGLLLGAVAGWWTTRVASHPVPGLVGLEVGSAQNEVSELGWEVVVVDESSDTVAAGQVMRSDPAEGTKLSEGSVLTLTVSSGPAPQPLPELTGLSLSDAEASLDDVGLVVAQAADEFSETVAVGTVVSWRVPDTPTLAAGDTVLPGTTVEVTLSAGPRPRVVPDLLGLAPADAIAALEAEGLVGVQDPNPQFHPTIAAGLVMAQDIAGGSEVARGTTITVAVSQGPDLVVVPELGLISRDEVATRLADAGLVFGTAFGNPTGVVVEATGAGIGVLTAGQQIPRGTVVDVTLF